ncbi:hypothetical protein [Hyphomonas sp.]|uniref:hypothetical protein n=1 Tax=Hyphomonas sp. TaxID=87 RepID=UPI00391BAF28
MIDRYLTTAYLPETGAGRSAEAQMLWALGAPLMLFPALVFILTTTWFTIGGAIGPLFAWAVLTLSAAGALALPRLFMPALPRFIPAGSVALVTIAFLSASLIRDTSMDGQHYHFEAIYALAKGWNPVHGPPDLPFIGDPVTPWSIHYPRGAWVFSANLLAAGIPFTATKVLNCLALLSAAAIIPALLLRLGFSRIAALLLAAVILLNPVLLAQFFTSMNDGLLGLCLLMFAAALTTWLLHEDRFAALTGLAVMCFALNLKFSAIPVFVFPCAAACLAVFAVRGFRPAVSLGAVLLGAALFSITVLGWSPYMRNWLEHGHIFHPIMGAHALDIMTGEGPALDNTPHNLIGLSAFERFFFSVFSESHAGFETEAKVRWPFLMMPQELRAAGGVDVRLGGFGPFFSGALVLAVAGAGVMLARAGRLNRISLAFLIAAAIALLSVLIMPQNWWARYVPQFWFVPAFVAAAAMASGQRAAQFLGAMMILVMLLDSAIVGASASVQAAKRHVQSGAQISALASTGHTYCVDPDMVKARLYLMGRAGVDAHYVPSEELQCEDAAEIEAYGPDRFGGVICPCDR